MIGANLLLLLYFIVYLILLVTPLDTSIPLIETPLSLAVGAIFGLGLGVSGMTRRSKIYGFFTLNENWDPSLAFVMMGAVLVNMGTFSYILNIKKKPFLTRKISLPKISSPDIKLIFGAATFGVGWGICGMCPGPAMVNSVNFLPSILWLPSLAAGQLSWEFFENTYKSMMVTDSKVKKD
mmetsp:Transcript_1228/g.1356  ORF Transcript_1228/g.1356 Transcript_1228/m.1356 type:complete len:180 (+) Transcript_1228:557-1096(+)